MEKKGISDVLHEVGHGQIHEDLSGALDAQLADQRRLAKQRGVAVSGTMTITLGFVVNPTGEVTIDVGHTNKVKVPKYASSHMWLGDKGLSLDNPKQTTLPGVMRTPRAPEMHGTSNNPDDGDEPN